MNRTLLRCVAPLLGSLFLQCLSAESGYKTEEHRLAEFSDGGHTLLLKLVHTSGFNNTYHSVQLLLDSQLVDFYGQIKGIDGQLWGKIWPIHREDRAHLRRERLAPQPTGEQRTWTIWVNPTQFSVADYELVKSLLTKGRTAIRTQQEAFYQNLGSRTYLNVSAIRLPTLNPLELVYADYGQFRERTYARAADVITIGFGGDVRFHRQQGNEATHVLALGELSDGGDALLVNLDEWQAAGPGYSIAQFTGFTNAQGRRLGERYRVTK
jgi:hypothetical protein